jgi:tellurite resistance protein TerB
MGIWDNIKSSVSNMSSNLQTSVAKFKNKDFSDACMAMCALIAAADGTVDSTERQKTAALIMNNDILKIFPADDLRSKFDEYCNKLGTDYDFGKISLIQVLGKLRNKPDQARAVIQIGLVIGGADGNFDQAERKIVKEACNAVGINPAEFDL